MEQPSEDIERVIEKLRKEVPRRKCSENAFAAKVREHYLEIKDMRKEGYSYLQILSAFQSEKLLPVSSKENSFKQAFRREFMRREGVGIKTGTLVSAPTPKKVVKPERKPEKAAPTLSVPKQNGETPEQERMRKLGLGKPIDMGNGTVIRKNTDGSFDYD
jgi:hypothetical protein